MKTLLLRALFVLWMGLLQTNLTIAQQQGGRQPLARPGQLNVDASRVFTFVKGSGLGHSHGMEATFAGGRLELGAEVDAGQFVIDMTSFDADTPCARQAVGLKGTSANWMRKQVAKEMHGTKIIDSAQFPVAKFDIVSCKPVGIDGNTGLPSYALTGNFTLRDKTKPISFRVTIEEAKGWLHLTGQFSFKQSDYGIKPLSKGLGAIGVADQLTVFGDLWIAPTPQSLASVQRMRMR